MIKRGGDCKLDEKMKEQGEYLLKILSLCAVGKCMSCPLHNPNYCNYDCEQKLLKQTEEYLGKILDEMCVDQLC